MINLKFGLFWSGSKMSYMRYLTFVSLRKFHPNSIIELYTTNNYKTDEYKWHIEQQDFEKEIRGLDYIDKLKELDVIIKKINLFDKYAPNYQSDFFRWWWLNKNNGFYLDTDQIILKSFKGIDRDYKFIFSAYNAPSCGLYTPVGVLGAEHSEVVQYICENILNYYNPLNYNSIGPFLLRDIIISNLIDKKHFNTPSKYFYPIYDSSLISKIYNKGNLSDIDLNNSYSLHWFGGHPLSQSFNLKFTENDRKESLFNNILKEYEIC